LKQAKKGKKKKGTLDQPHEDHDKKEGGGGITEQAGGHGVQSPGARGEKHKDQTTGGFDAKGGIFFLLNKRGGGLFSLGG